MRPSARDWRARHDWLTPRVARFASSLGTRAVARFRGVDGAAEADDVSQEVLLQMLRAARAGTWRPERAKFATYFGRGAWSRAVHALIRLSRDRLHGTRSLEHEEERATWNSRGDERDVIDPRDPGVGPEAGVDGSDLIEVALDPLPPRERLVIRLRVLEGRGTVEVARRIAVSPTRVRQLVAGALDRIRAAVLAGELDLGVDASALSAIVSRAPGALQTA